jgi:hypothetical protein
MKVMQNHEVNLLISYLICGLFNNAASISDYTAPTDRLMSEMRSRKDVEVGGRDLIHYVHTNIHSYNTAILRISIHFILASVMYY